MTFLDADEFVEAFGCARCVRAKRSTYGRVLNLCGVCLRDLNRTLPIERQTETGWVLLRRPELAGYLTRTKVPWACVRFATDGTRDAHYAPVWASLLLDAGTQVRNARRDLGLSIVWTDVLSHAAETPGFRLPFEAVCALARQGNRTAGARAILQFIAAHAPAIAIDGHAPKASPEFGP